MLLILFETQNSEEIWHKSMWIPHWKCYRTRSPDRSCIVSQKMGGFNDWRLLQRYNVTITIVTIQVAIQ